MKISIARALKEKSRIVGEINRLNNIISSKNMISFSVNGGVNGEEPVVTDELISSKRNCDIKSVFEELTKQRNRLVDIKISITKANSEAADTLVKLSEAKSELSMLNSFNTSDNMVAVYSGNQYRVVNCVFDSIWVENRKKELTDLVNSLQDSIDEFNATHFVEFDV